jgi:hypothetical protein
MHSHRHKLIYVQKEYIENKIFFTMIARYLGVPNILCFKYFKGTVRPDWICMRVVSLECPLEAHQPL